MKTIRSLKRTLVATVGFTAVALLSPVAQADPPEKDNLPPGLRKKDKLPPGWQKKVGNQSPSVPAGTTSAATNAAPPAVPEVPKAPEPSRPAEPARAPEAKAPATTSTPAPSSPGKALTREQQERQVRLEKHLGDFDSVASQPAATDRVLGRLARITDTPEAKLREQWKAQPGVTVGQFYVASLIAKRSKSKTEQVLAEHKAGQRWGEVAVAHKVPIADLNEAMQEATTAARDAERKAQRAATN